MMKWQPIETAPRDGREFFGLFTYEKGDPFPEWRVRINPTTDGLEVFRRVDYDFEDWEPEYDFQFIGWMPQPLPQPPEE